MFKGMSNLKWIRWRGALGIDFMVENVKHSSRVHSEGKTHVSQGNYSVTQDFDFPKASCFLSVSLKPQQYLLSCIIGGMLVEL